MCRIPCRLVSIQHVGHVYALLQLLEAPARVQFLPIPGSEHLLEQVILSHALRGWRPEDLVWPVEHVRDMAVRGRNVCLMTGKSPSCFCRRQASGA